MPLCHALRLAEETATIDQISQGRLLFGVGRSGNPRSYVAYGVPYSESRERFLQTLEIIKRAWTQPTFSYEGKNAQLHIEALNYALANIPADRLRFSSVLGQPRRPASLRRPAARHHSDRVSGEAQRPFL